MMWSLRIYFLQNIGLYLIHSSALDLFRILKTMSMNKSQKDLIVISDSKVIKVYKKPITKKNP